MIFTAAQWSEWLDKPITKWIIEQLQQDEKKFLEALESKPLTPISDAALIITTERAGLMAVRKYTQYPFEQLAKARRREEQ